MICLPGVVDETFRDRLLEECACPQCVSARLDDALDEGDAFLLHHPEHIRLRSADDPHGDDDHQQGENDHDGDDVPGIDVCAKPDWGKDTHG
ncbi:hypothetical protein AMJ39_09255 [candidate division TA06 bacterium DG_24]|uniref:Uncharacterized protein n=1 Tax=candidate division TA06 bacterium DG_24 TaxID=1703770 RepID=A0A0S7WNT4_UNCT6|nr:MAG: hypothetical protein AMJ39_09255 [candidate division TA06 bacterium DG_24]